MSKLFICLSAAPNLRCQALSMLQAQLFIIPPALEVVFALSLVVAKWRSGSRIHLLLAAEGCVYFALALFDLLSHIVPSVRRSLTIFKNLDIIIASASFLPLLLYTLFLFLFTSGKLVQSLPMRYRRITKYLIIIFIPAIVALNELGSFIGIARRIISTKFGPIIIVGFRSTEAQTLWTFFSSVTLALLTIYQAINFVLTFYQLIRVFVDQHRIEESQSDEAHLFHGIGWIATGVKLGAIESIIGFAPAAFGGAFTRRVLRLLGRACLCIGVVKGLDTAEDFRNIHEELRGGSFFRRSRVKPLISNPRHSTFRHLSPSQAAFHEHPRAPQFSPDQVMSTKSPSIATFDMRTPAPWSPAVQSPAENQSAGYTTQRNIMSVAYPTSNYAPSFGSLSPNATPTLETPRLRPQRVTVLHEQGQAPTLQMRFSTLDIPSPSALESAKFHYPSGASGFLSTSSDYPTVYLQSPPKAIPRSTLPRTRSTFDIDSSEKHRYNRSNSYVPRARAMSSDSSASDSLSAVRNLAAQFPGLPPRVTGKARGSILGDYYSDDGYTGVSREPSTKTYGSENSHSSMIPGLSHSNSLAKRKPPPALPRLDTTSDNVSNAASRNHSTRAEAGHEVSYYLPGDGSTASSPSTQVMSTFDFASRRESSVGTPATEDHNPFGYDAAGLSSKSQTFASSEYGVGSSASIHSAEWLATASRGQRVTAVDIEAYRKGVERATRTVSQAPSEAPTARDSFGDQLAPTDTPWLGNANDVNPQREAWGREGLTRIKTVGSAPLKATPTPTHGTLSAVSMLIDRTEVEAMMDEIPRQESGYAV